MATNPADIAPSEDDFDAAFNEIADGTPPPVSNDAEDGDAALPADEAASEEANVAGDQPPAGAEPSDDIWASAPPEIREAREKEMRDYNFRLQSQQGRVSALHRKTQQLEQQLSQGGGGQPAAQPGGGAEPAAAEDGADDPLKQLVEDYPDIGTPLAAMFTDLKAQLAEARQQVAPLAQSQAEAVRTAQYGILSARHPDWQTLSTDERWGGWITTQPRAVQEAFARNQDVSDGEEAAWVLDLFKRDVGITPAAPTPSPTPTPTPSPADQRRQRQLDAARDGGGNGGATVTNDLPDDFDAEFDRISAQKQQRRSSR